MSTQPSFEENLAELNNTLDLLASPDTSLEQALALYKKAAELTLVCKNELSEAQVKIEEIAKSMGEAIDDKN